MISADKRPYDNRVVAIVVGISWGAVAFAYAGSVIGTTLGQLLLAQRVLNTYLSVQASPRSSHTWDLTMTPMPKA